MQGLVVERQNNKIRINSRTWIIEKKERENNYTPPLVESQAIAVKDKEKRGSKNGKGNLYLAGRTEILSLNLERIYRNVIKHTEKLKGEGKLETSLTDNEPLLMKDTLVLLYYMGRKAVLKKFLSWKLKKQVKYLSNPYLFYLNKHLDFHSSKVISMRTQTPMAPILTVYAYAYHILEEAYKNGRESITENHLMFELAEMLDMEEDKVEGEIEIMKAGKISGNMPIFDGGYVYLPWVYFLRKSALKMLAEVKPDSNGAVNEIVLPDNGNGDSKKAHELLSQLAANKYTILTGGPGTGKTTLLERIAGIIPNTQLSALTGKAAQRLGEDARTVHSLLGFGPRGFSKKELDCNLLIVDEASMMNWRTLHAVLLASPRIIFSGDPEQLPPVGGESVFKKMIETLPVVKLDKTWRFKNGLCVETIKKETEKEVFVALSNLLTALKHKDFQVITPIHGGLLGTRYLNTYIQGSFNPSPVILDNLRYKDRVIVTRNIYLDGELIAANGQVGIAEGVDTVEGNIYVCVGFQRNGSYNGSHNSSHNGSQRNGRVLVDRKDLELAYALTVHKYQGSECDYVVFIIPDRKKVREDFITDEMVLVGKTRGRMKTYVLEATGG